MVYTFLLACAPEPSSIGSDPAPDELPDEPTPPAEVPPATDAPPPVTEPAPTEPAAGNPTAADCFGAQWGAEPPVDYDSLGPTIGTHCKGTDHQDIEGIERVVFVGDSITLGTPPTPNRTWWRNQLADSLAARFGLERPSDRWRSVHLLDGVPLETFSGDFADCAKWGARTDDLFQDPHRQLETCMPEADRGLRTLVVMTIGGNDIFSLLEDARAGVDEATLRATYELALDELRTSIDWVVTPGRFPNGVAVVFANTYDFTDPHGAEDMARCDGARLIGMSEPLRNPIVQDILAHAQEEYLRLAVETGTDLVFLGEHFCGHGWAADDPGGRCYRGPGSEVWLDLTCEHPNGAGHDALTDLFEAVIAE